MFNGWWIIFILCEQPEANVSSAITRCFLGRGGFWFLLSLFLAQPTMAAMPNKSGESWLQICNPPNGKPEREYCVGYLAGLLDANAILVVGKKPLWCFPQAGIKRMDRERLCSFRSGAQ